MDVTGKYDGSPETPVMRRMKRYEAEGAKQYREANKRIQKAVKKAKEDWIGTQCVKIKTGMNKNNSYCKRAYQLVNNLP